MGDVAKGIIQMVSAMGDEADSIPDGKRMSDMTNVFSKALPGLADYLLDNRDEVRLLLKCSDGTKYENFLDGLMQRDLDSMKEIAGDSFPLNPLSSALLVNSYFKALGDAAISGRPRDEIIQAMQDIQDMFAGGMIYLMKGRN